MRFSKTAVASTVLSLSFFAAGRVSADTISVQTLNYVGTDAISGYDWDYAASLSAYGQVEPGDYFTITDVQGLTSLPGGSGEILSGLGGSTWTVTDDIAAETITATEKTGDVENPSGAFPPPLLDIPFVDSYSNATGTAVWGSQDHDLNGVSELPLTGQYIPSPGPANTNTSTPLPASSTAGILMLGLVGVASRAKRSALA